MLLLMKLPLSMCDSALTKHIGVSNHYPAIQRQSGSWTLIPNIGYIIITRLQTSDWCYFLYWQGICQIHWPKLLFSNGWLSATLAVAGEQVWQRSSVSVTGTGRVWGNITKHKAQQKMQGEYRSAFVAMAAHQSPV